MTYYNCDASAQPLSSIQVVSAVIFHGRNAGPTSHYLLAVVPEEGDTPFCPIEHFRVLPELHTDIGLRYPVYDLTVDTGDELARPVVLNPLQLRTSDIVVISFVVVRKLHKGLYHIALMADRVTRVARFPSSTVEQVHLPHV